MQKRGVSEIIATVLIILITIVTVAIIWAAIIPLIEDSLSFSDINGRVSVVTSEGYTAYDAQKKIAIVQVKRENDDNQISRVKIYFSIDGNSVSSSVSAPSPDGKKSYAFDLSGYDKPDKVSVSPIFVNGNGKEKEGSITSAIDMPSGTITNLPSTILKIGGSYFYDEVPSAGLVNWWKFNGDFTDSVGGNNGVANGNAYINGNGELVLNGNTDWVQTNNALTSSNYLSISMWVYSYNLTNPTGSSLIGNAHSGDNYNLWYWRPAGTNDLRLYNGPTLTTINNFFSNSPGWINFLSVTDYTQNKSYYYKNGINIANFSGAMLFPSGSPYLTIGNYKNAIHTSFNGSIDNLMIYNKMLSADEIKTIYNLQGK